VNGPTLAQLARIRAELLRLNNRLEDLGRYEKLTRLCMSARQESSSTFEAMDARDILIEVNNLKAQELPF
jgi:hypothetical protein